MLFRSSVGRIVPARGGFALLPVVLALAAFLAAAPRLPAQDSVRETRLLASEALGKGDFANAILYLRKLAEWFSSSDKANTLVDLENTYYYLGVCHFFLGQFDESRKWFDVYMKQFSRHPRANQIAMYAADALRFQNKLDEALRAYGDALKKYFYIPADTADLYAAMARCHLAREQWKEAVPHLLNMYRVAPDLDRKTWAASLLTVSWLQTLDVNPVYQVMPFLVRRNSFASRSVALNMTALQAGDALFADERYREALWVYRLVYPYDELRENCETYRGLVRAQAERLRRGGRNPRLLMKVQEELGEVEAELEALSKVPKYDSELNFRIARSYMEIRRYFEAGDLFYSLYLDGLEGKDQECLYLAFMCGVQVSPKDRAKKRGEEYMKKYPGAEHYDAVSLILAQIWAEEKNWKKVIAVLEEALEVHPKHENIVECLYLLGYAHFMEEHYGDTIRYLTRMNGEFPGNEREADGYYWRGMAYLFDKQYENGRGDFDRVVQNFPNCLYFEDARFRSAVCDYALANYPPAEEKLLRFAGDYPDHKLIGEVYLLLGDISGVDGELAEGVRRYQKALSFDDRINIEQYNHAYFRTGEMLRELKRHEDVIAFFKPYMERNREGSNIPLAIYNTATAYWDMERRPEAVRFYREAMQTYGPDRKAVGTDLIFEEWVGRTRQLDEDARRAEWQFLRDMVRQARDANRQPLLLRGLRTLMFDPDVTPKEKDILRQTIVAERNLTNASPTILDFIMDEAGKDGNADLEIKAAETVVRDFTETDVALSARIRLARQAFGQERFDDAIAHLNVIREVFATSEQAGEALLMLGEINRRQMKYKEADENYRSVLGVKAWKSKWPEALFGRGEVFRAQREFAQAAAYFERIYVLYSANTAWAARAYVARAECLSRLGEYKKAGETLKELLALPEYEKQEAERKKAEELLKEYSRKLNV